MASDAQVRKVNVCLSKCGFANDVARHARLADIVGHPVESCNDLTKAEISKAIDQLEADALALQ